MIVSYKHNFVFVKTKKTAGTSMEMALTGHAGPDDIVTPMGHPDEYNRYAENPEALARNYSDDPAGEEVYREAIRERLRGAPLRAAKVGVSHVHFFNHMSAAAAKERLGDTFWDRAFKFTIERHPYEKAVSLAWMHSGGRADVLDVLDEVVNRRTYGNFHRYTDKSGSLLVDYVIRYEALAEGVRHVETVLGLHILSRLPEAKSKYRRDTRPAHELLSRQQKQIIQDICKPEFELFGYEP